MRLALIQWAPGIGRLEHNAERMGELAKKAALQGADAVVFPELSLVGYPPMDLLREPGLQEACTKALGTLAASADDTPFGRGTFQGGFGSVQRRFLVSPRGGPRSRTQSIVTQLRCL